MYLEPKDRTRDNLAPSYCNGYFPFGGFLYPAFTTFGAIKNGDLRWRGLGLDHKTNQHYIFKRLFAQPFARTSPAFERTVPLHTHRYMKYMISVDSSWQDYKKLQVGACLFRMLNFDCDGSRAVDGRTLAPGFLFGRLVHRVCKTLQTLFEVM